MTVLEVLFTTGLIFILACGFWAFCRWLFRHGRH
jgi:hypothetical protein